MKRTAQTLTRLLRTTLAEATARGESFRSIAQATGLKHQALSRFARGEQSLRLDKADRLAEHFGIEHRSPRGRKGR